MKDVHIRIATIGVSVLAHTSLLIQAGGEQGVQQLLKIPSTQITRVAFSAPQSEALLKPEQVREKIKTEQSEKQVFKPKQEPVKEKIEEQAEVQAQVQKMSATPLAAVDKGILEAERQRYLADVMAHIEKHKWYPKAARRRGIQGDVSISFLLMDDGSIGHVHVENGAEILRGAAKQAVAKAEPMPTPPANVDCPLPCKFAMRFALN